LAGGIAAGSARSNPDAKLRFDPLPIPDPPMPTLKRPMILPRVLGSFQQSNNGSQSALVPRKVRNTGQSSARASQSQASSRRSSQKENEIDVDV
jgi:hypothetical protein